MKWPRCHSDMHCHCINGMILCTDAGELIAAEGVKESLGLDAYWDWYHHMRNELHCSRSQRGPNQIPGGHLRGVILGYKLGCKASWQKLWRQGH